MSEKKPAEELALQAYLYAAGELPQSEREVFEQRLELEQSAREALAEAVQMSASVAGRTTRPASSYRLGVRRRLRPTWWRRLLGRRFYPGHPLLWALGGAAASLIVALPLLRPAPEVYVVERPSAPAPKVPDVAVDPDLGDMAFIWAELSTPDHVIQAHAQEQRRKTRMEDRKQSRTARAPGEH
jgi:hypothetical protein